MKWLGRIFRRPAVFALEIDPDGSHRVEGTLPPLKLHLIADVLAESGVTTGTIFGVRKGGRVLLEFSPSIPSHIQQRLRNVWVAER